MTLLEIRERMFCFKKEASGKESYAEAAGPFPKTRPMEEDDAWKNHPMQEWMDSVRK